MDEAQLVSALRRQDPQAVAQLVDTLGDRLFRSACLLCGHAADAQDLVQETFLQALQSADRFRGASSVYTWLHGILLNLTRHHLRSRRRIVYDDRLAVAEEAATPEPLPLAADLEIASGELQRALQRLPEPSREILVLRFYEEMKMDEIARHLAIPPGTAKSRLHYALKQMQRLVPEELNLFGSHGTQTTKTP